MGYRQECFTLLANEDWISMEIWRDFKMRELLAMCNEEEIKRQMSRMVRDSTVYENITKLLNQRGIWWSQKQITNKLKALKKNYTKIHDHSKNQSSVGQMDWEYYDLCNSVFRHTALTNPVQLSSSSRQVREETQLPSPSPLPSNFLSNEKEREEMSNMASSSETTEDSNLLDTTCSFQLSGK